MDRFVTAFLKASLVWLGLGVSAGVAMAIHPPWTVYRPAHLHMNLLGFVAMMIFGVALHVMPRFTGHPLHSRRLAVAQWWLANGGLALFVGGFMLRPHAAFGTPARALLATGGALSAAAAYAFIYNVWRTIDGKGLRHASAHRVSEPAAAPVLHRLSRP